LVAKINGHPINWVKHVAFAKKMREHVKSKKEKIKKKKP